MRLTLRTIARWGALTLFLASPTWAHAVSERLFDCEQQAKRLASCCDTDPRPPLVCVTPGCNSSVELTSEEEVRCLEELSCEAIRSRGLCAAPDTCTTGGPIARWEGGR